MRRGPVNREISRYTTHIDVVDNLIKLGRTMPKLTREEEYRLIKLAQSGSKEARDKLILSNINFVIFAAKRCKLRIGDLSDAIMDGVVGMNRAIDKFDTNTGIKFISYAVWWIRQSIEHNGARTREFGVVLPTEVQRCENRIFNELDMGFKLNGSMPAKTDVALKLGISQSIVDTACVGCYAVSYDIPTSDNAKDDRDLLETLYNKSDAQYDENSAYDKSFYKNKVHFLVDSVLNEKERYVVENFYGINKSNTMSDRELGNELGLSHQRIQQMRTTALQKMRHFASGNYKKKNMKKKNIK